jgi:hypothetical protein
VQQVQVLTWRDGEPDPRLGRELTTVIPATSSSGTAAGVLDLPHPDAGARARFARPGLFPVDALWWTDGDTAPPASLLTALELTVETHVGWVADAADVDVDVADAVKQVSFLHASAGTPLDEFRAHYRDHVEVARRHMPALWQYRQHDVVGVRGPNAEVGAGVVAVSELWFRSTDDFLHRYFASAEDEAEFRSHEGFLDLPKAFSFVCASHAFRDGST